MQKEGNSHRRNRGIEFIFRQDDRIDLRRKGETAIGLLKVVYLATSCCRVKCNKIQIFWRHKL